MSRVRTEFLDAPPNGSLAAGDFHLREEPDEEKDDEEEVKIDERDNDERDMDDERDSGYSV